MSRGASVEGYTFRRTADSGESEGGRGLEGSTNFHGNSNEQNKQMNFLTSRWYVEAAGIDRTVIFDTLERYEAQGYSTGMRLLRGNPDIAHVLQNVSDDAAVARAGILVYLEEILTDLVDGSSLCADGSDAGQWMNKAWLTPEAISAALVRATVRDGGMTEYDALETIHTGLSVDYIGMCETTGHVLEEVITSARARGEDMRPTPRMF